MNDNKNFSLWATVGCICFVLGIYGHITNEVWLLFEEVPTHWVFGLCDFIDWPGTLFGAGVLVGGQMSEDAMKKATKQLEVCDETNILG